MNRRRIITNIISLALIAALFYFLWDIYHPLTVLAHRLELNTRFYILSVVMELMISLICFLSMRNWFEYFLNGGIKLKIIPFIVGLAVLIVGALPAAFWVIHVGLGGNIKMLLNQPATHHVVSAVAGVLIGRSFGHKSDA